MMNGYHYGVISGKSYRPWKHRGWKKCRRAGGKKCRRRHGKGRRRGWWSRVFAWKEWRKNRRRRGRKSLDREFWAAMHGRGRKSCIVQSKIFKLVNCFNGTQAEFLQKVSKLKNFWAKRQEKMEAFVERLPAGYYENWKNSEIGKAVLAKRAAMKEKNQQWFDDWANFTGTEEQFQQKLEGQRVQMKKEREEMHKKLREERAARREKRYKEYSVSVIAEPKVAVLQQAQPVYDGKIETVGGSLQ